MKDPGRYFEVIVLFWFAIGFYKLENDYFGWNRYPQSEAEVLADGLVYVLLAIAVFALALIRNCKGGEE